MTGYNALTSVISAVASTAYLLSREMEPQPLYFFKSPLQDLYEKACDPYVSDEALRFSQFDTEIPSEVRDLSGDRSALKSKIEEMASQILYKQPIETQNAVFGLIYALHGYPQTSDPCWGQHNALNRHDLLLRALQRAHCLGPASHTIQVDEHWEANCVSKSCPYTLGDRENLEYGEICYINGMGCSFDNARRDARKLSDNVGLNKNFQCVYSATQGFETDIKQAILADGGVVTRAMRILVERMQNYFDREDGNFLLICHSRGSVETYQALNILPEDLRGRVIVIALAPAKLIPEHLARKVFNFGIPQDPVFGCLGGSGKKICLDTQPENPHNPHGESFKSAVAPLVRSYIEHNDC
ncbi:MAG: hypothetical protein JSS61_07435 [Verrucomicrobia bacterium]|nr:hypothetical protein [Verrucomicrobiota bacterium]